MYNLIKDIAKILMYFCYLIPICFQFLINKIFYSSESVSKCAKCDTLWSFSYRCYDVIPLFNLFWGHMTILYPNLCYKEVPLYSSEKKNVFLFILENMSESFQDYSWIQDIEAYFP